MVSANNTANETAGLAQDVPLEIAPGIVVYLQLHVIGQASYDVLLGKPPLVDPILVSIFFPFTS